MQIWGHRGASRDAPENTLPAIELAVSQGADGVEIDVQLSRDGHIVVIHDESVDRTTDGTGQVRDMALDGLRSLDASHGDERHAGAQIPVLSEVLDLTRTVMLNIELKNDQVTYPGLEELVLGTVARHGAAERVLYSSFSQRSVRRLRQLEVSAPVGMLYSRPRPRPVADALAWGATAIHPPARAVRPGLVNRAHRRGLPVNVWTVNDAADVRRMARLGVDAIISDAPGAAREALGAGP